MQEDFVDASFEYGSFLDPQGRLFVPALENVEVVVRGKIIYRYLNEEGVCNVSREVVGRCLGLMIAGAAAKVNLPGGRWMRRKEKRLFLSC